MAILCLVIKVTNSPMDRQTQLQVVAQGSSPGVEPILDTPERTQAGHSGVQPPPHRRCKPRCTA